VGTKEYCVGTK